MSHTRRQCIHLYSHLNTEHIIFCALCFFFTTSYRFNSIQFRRVSNNKIKFNLPSNEYTCFPLTNEIIDIFFAAQVISLSSAVRPLSLFIFVNIFRKKRNWKHRKVNPILFQQLNISIYARRVALCYWIHLGIAHHIDINVLVSVLPKFAMYTWSMQHET